MSSTKKIILAGLVIVLAGSAIFALTNKNNTTTSSTTTKSGSSDAMMKKDSASADAMMKKDSAPADAMKKDSSSDAMMKKDESSAMTKTDVMVKPGQYTTYSSDLVANATGNTVLFFNATWCPTCQATVKNINASLDKIPSNVNILSTDYDTNADLKTKYGVTMQHTFVKVDKAGNLIKKVSGLSTVEEIAAFANS